MSTENMVGKQITFKDWKGDTREGEITAILKNGDYEVSTDRGIALVTNSEILKMKRGGYIPKATQMKRAKVAEVMHEFKEGKLHSGSKNGPIVKDRDQAIAIALAEANSKKMAEGGEIKITRAVNSVGKIINPGKKVLAKYTVASSLKGEIYKVTVDNNRFSFSSFEKMNDWANKYFSNNSKKMGTGGGTKDASIVAIMPSNTIVGRKVLKWLEKNNIKMNFDGEHNWHTKGYGEEIYLEDEANSKNSKWVYIFDLKDFSNRKELEKGLVELENENKLKIAISYLIETPDWVYESYEDDKMGTGGGVNKVTYKTDDEIYANDIVKYADLQNIKASKRKVGNYYYVTADSAIETRESMTGKLKNLVASKMSKGGEMGWKHKMAKGGGVAQPEWLFIGVYPNAYVYSDKRDQKSGDYHKIGQVTFSPLRLNIFDDSKKYADVQKIMIANMARLKKQGEVEISATGQKAKINMAKGGGVDEFPEVVLEIYANNEYYRKTNWTEKALIDVTNQKIKFTELDTGSGNFRIAWKKVYENSNGYYIDYNYFGGRIFIENWYSLCQENKPERKIAKGGGVDGNMLINKEDGSEIVGIESKEHESSLDESFKRPTDYDESRDAEYILRVFNSGKASLYNFFDKYGNQYEYDELVENNKKMAKGGGISESHNKILDNFWNQRHIKLIEYVSSNEEIYDEYIALGLSEEEANLELEQKTKDQALTLMYLYYNKYGLKGITELAKNLKNKYAEGGGVKETKTKMGKITISDIISGARFKAKSGTVFIVDSTDGKIVESSFEGGAKGNYRDPIGDFVAFMNEQKATRVMATGGSMYAGGGAIPKYLPSTKSEIDALPKMGSSAKDGWEFLQMETHYREVLMNNLMFHNRIPGRETKVVVEKRIVPTIHGDRIDTGWTLYIRNNKKSNGGSMYVEGGGLERSFDKKELLDEMIKTPWGIGRIYEISGSGSDEHVKIDIKGETHIMNMGEIDEDDIVKYATGGLADGGSKIYKLRAEGLNDFLDFLQNGMYFRVKSFTVQPIGVPDVVVSFETDASLSEIKSKLREIPDSHVMVETVKPINEYTGDRDGDEKMATGGSAGGGDVYKKSFNMPNDAVIAKYYGDSVEKLRKSQMDTLRDAYYKDVILPSKEEYEAKKKTQELELKNRFSKEYDNLLKRQSADEIAEEADLDMRDGRSNSEMKKEWVEMKLKVYPYKMAKGGSMGWKHKMK